RLGEFRKWWRWRRENPQPTEGIWASDDSHAANAAPSTANRPTADDAASTIAGEGTTTTYNHRSAADVESTDANVNREYCERFIQATDLLATVLPEIVPLDDEETLSYLHGCVSSKRHRVRRPDVPAYLDAILADEPLTGGLAPAIGRSHLRTVTVLG